MQEKGLKGLRVKIREKGLFHVLKRSFSIATSGIYSNVRLYRIVHDLTEKIPELELPSGFNQAILNRDELDKLLPLVGKKRIGLYRERVERGIHCVAAMKDGVVVSFVWYSPVDVLDDILGIRIPVGGGEAYSFDALTSHEFRHRGLFFSIISYLLDDLKSRGFERVTATHNSGDIVRVFPKYGRAGIPARITDVVDCRKILLWMRVKWSEYDGHLDNEN